jgi:hypothetical protein
MAGREYGPLLVPERIMYLHYMSSNQRLIQQLLEKTAEDKKLELVEFITETNKLCHVDQV